MQDSRNLKLEPLPHIVFVFLLAYKNSDVLVLAISLYLIFHILEEQEYTVDAFKVVFEMVKLNQVCP